VFSCLELQHISIYLEEGCRGRYGAFPVTRSGHLPHDDDLALALHSRGSRLTSSPGVPVCGGKGAIRWPIAASAIEPIQKVLRR
jgi:hypothetical protein